MNAQENWGSDDYSLQAEFQDVGELFQLHIDVQKEIKVPKKLDKIVRRQAKLIHQDKLEENWIFSPAIRLALATILLFCIALLFVMSTQAESKNTAHSYSFQLLDGRSLHTRASILSDLQKR